MKIYNSKWLKINMVFSLPKLPYAYNALEPIIDAKTMEIHHTKHHQTYVDKLNEAVGKYSSLANKSAEELLMDFFHIPEDIKTAVRNHGGGHVNHSLFWQLMTPVKKDSEFKGKVARAIEKSFGSLDAFKQIFADVALKRFGSGWAWLVLASDGSLEVTSTANQDSPLMDGKIPLLGLDVWEHAYYLKHTSNRKAYVDGWWNVVNWSKVNELYEQNFKRSN
jgi:Fe-Mn family superoxide dismutase